MTDDILVSIEQRLAELRDEIKKLEGARSALNGQRSASTGGAQARAKAPRTRSRRRNLSPEQRIAQIEKVIIGSKGPMKVTAVAQAVKLSPARVHQLVPKAKGVKKTKQGLVSA
jgi:G3E family GTPase